MTPHLSNFLREKTAALLSYSVFAQKCEELLSAKVRRNVFLSLEEFLFDNGLSYGGEEKKKKWSFLFFFFLENVLCSLLYLDHEGVITAFGFAS